MSLKRVSRVRGDISRGYVGCRDVKYTRKSVGSKSLYITHQVALIPRSYRVRQQTNPMINCHSEKGKSEGERDMSFCFER